MKIYRLLRNNKESGPYTADELIAFGLKQYDLIWADGRSAAWRYPSEIPEFKGFAPEVTEQPFDRFYKKQTAEQKIVPAQNVETIVAEPVRKSKPKIKIKADWNVVEEKKPIEKKAEPIIEQKIAEEKINWQDAWLNWDMEKKSAAANEKNKLPDYSKEKNEEPVLETKYSASLDDIKMQYMQTVLQAKKKESIFSLQVLGKYAVPAAALIIIAFGGLWLSGKWGTKKQYASIPNNTQQAPTENLSAENEVTAPANNSSNFISTIDKQDNQQPQQNDEHVTFITVTKKDKPFLKNNGNISQSQSVSPSSKNSNTVVDDNETPVVVPSSNNTKTEDNPSPIKKYSTEKTVNDYVRVSPAANLTSDGAELKVLNTSDIPFDLVVIDLEYYDASNHYKKGETLYIKNLQPGKNMTVKAPADNASVSVKSRISMISSDEKNIYLTGE